MVMDVLFSHTQHNCTIAITKRQGCVEFYIYCLFLKTWLSKVEGVGEYPTPSNQHNNNNNNSNKKDLIERYYIYSEITISYI